MREIKFRAWDPNANVMHNDIGISKIYLYDFDGDNITEQEALVIMQYTGLYDKNNVAIYEGDIVRYDCVTYPEVAPSGSYKIEYSTASFVGVNTEDDSIELDFGYWFNQEGKEFLEIIGNIYENADLLTI